LLKFWTRTTIEFDVNCDAGTIQDAIDVLEEMDDNRGDTYTVNLVTLIFAVVSASYQLVYMIVNTICLCNSKLRRNEEWFKASNIFYNSSALFITTCVLGCAISNYYLSYPKYSSLNQW